MKKLFAILLIGVLSLGAFVGCGKDKNVITIHYGSLSSPGYTDEANNEKEENYLSAYNLSKTVEKDGKTYEIVQTPFDNLATMTMALRKGEIVNISLSSQVGKYIAATNDDIEVREPVENSPNFYNGFAFMFTDDNTTLRDMFSQAIKAIKDDGTLGDLIKNYIVEIDPNEKVPRVEMPSFPGADTIKVAITGDLPPMDYVDEDGNPAGFNTALLAKIAEKLEVNIEFVSIDSASRAIALSTKKADVSFWTRCKPDTAVIKKIFDDSSYNESLPNYGDTFDNPAGTITSDVYYNDYIVYLTMKKAE